MDNIYLPPNVIKDSSREFIQENWYKNIIEGEIPFSNTLKITSNKREAIYVEEGIFNNTKPFYYDEIFN